MVESLLRLDEANELLSAWACAQAERHGIRSLLVKGRALSDHGLRTPRVSADVDVLIEPARFDEYCALVVDAGWDEFPSTFASEHFTLHSRSFHRDGWPNSFDVHSYFPGFLRDPGEVFDALWARRVLLDFGDRACPAPDRVASLFVLTLHSLRGTDRQARHAEELAAATRIELTPEERADAAGLAVATGAAAALRDVLPAWGVDVAVDEAEFGTPAYLEWHRKVTTARGYGAAWLALLAKAPLREKPRVAARAVWPTRADLLVGHPEIEDRPWPRFRTRVARLARGIASLPRALAALRRR